MVTAPVGYPVTLDEARHQVQQAGTVDDDYLGLVVLPAATERAESATGRALLTQTWDLTLDRFPDDRYIEIPRPPLVSVTHVKYYNTSGTLVTLTANTDYVVESGARLRRGRVGLLASGVWPVPRDQQGAVIVRFICGYGTSQSVPALLKAGILLDVATLYAQRENVIVGTIVSDLPYASRNIYWTCRSPRTQFGGEA